MPIYRCNKCGCIAETSAVAAGNKTPCAKCSNLCTVYETIYFVEKLTERYFAALREIESLKAVDKPVSSANGTEREAVPVASNPQIALGQLKLSNTDRLATAEQHQALKVWFASRQIEAQFDYSTVDTTGFFDDAALALGENFSLFAELLNRIRYAYRNSHSGLNLELANLSQKDAQAITNLCRQFYSHTLFARYHYQKPEKIVRLTLQTVPKVRQFFEGGWLEWWALMTLLELIKVKNLTASCARGVKVVFPNEDLHEIDVMALVNGKTPVYIECKTGDFRREIDKSLRLKKRLAIERKQFIICVSDLTEEQATGLTAMYELTFVNLQMLPTALEALL